MRSELADEILTTDRVLIPLDEFSAWQETTYLLLNPVNVNRLITSIQSAEMGKVFEKSLIEE